MILLVITISLFMIFLCVLIVDEWLSRKGKKEEGEE